jgi:hypothetical protein
VMVLGTTVFLLVLAFVQLVRQSRLFTRHRWCVRCDAQIHHAIDDRQWYCHDCLPSIPSARVVLT